MSRPTFLLIDGHAVIYRAYFGFPGLSTKAGLLVNAVFGFSRILLTAIQEFEPEFIAVTYDHPKPTFRHKEFQNYKAQRPKMPDDLIAQIDIIKKVVTALNIPQFEMEGYEADDLIGTICRLVSEGKYSNGGAHTTSTLQTIVVTGDKDAFQLVDDDTHVWLPGRGKFQVDKEYCHDDVIEKMGVTPLQVIDLKALMGDASDNIPGIRGIGPKTAVKLVAEFGSVEALYQYLDEKLGTDVSMDELENDPKKTVALSKQLDHVTLRGSNLKKVLLGRSDAFLSKKLATIDLHVPLQLDLESCRVTSYDKQQAVDIFLEYDFKSLIQLLPVDEFQSSVQDALF